MEKRMITKEECLKELKRLDSINKDAITQVQFLNGSKFSMFTYNHYFDSLDNALKTAELKTIKERYVCYHRKVLLDEYISLYERLGKTPSKNDIKKYSKFSVTFYENIFGNMTNVCKEANISANLGGETAKISKEELIYELKKFGKKLGRAPRKDETNTKNCKYSSNAYKRAFGSWNNALLAAEFDITMDHVTTEGIIEEIKSVASLLGRSPSFDEFKQHTKLKSFAIYAHFDSWNDAVKKAGFEPFKISSVTDEELRQEVKKVHDLFGIVPTWELFNAHSKYSSTSVVGHFGGQEKTWEAAMKNLGYDYKTTYTFIKPFPQIGIDGRKYKSKIEAAVANYLYLAKQKGANIEYVYEQKLTKDRNWTCDFYVISNDEELYIEVDGMKKAREVTYDDEKNEKINFYKNNNLNLVIVKTEVSIPRLIDSFVSSLIN